ncbi:protein phosphatase 1 regulatory subunit 3G-like [Arapaima gigas]
MLGLHRSSPFFFHSPPPTWTVAHTRTPGSCSRTRLQLPKRCLCFSCFTAWHHISSPYFCSQFVLQFLHLFLRESLPPLPRNFSCRCRARATGHLGQRADAHMETTHANHDGVAHADEEDEEPPPLRERRRAKSLPAYPEQAAALEALSRRKSVRFADSLGLSLASVRHYSAAEEPRVPPPTAAPAPPQRHRSFPAARLVPAFQMPAECGDFEGRARLQHVSLERLAVGQFDVTGFIRVPAWSAATHVAVRYTFNDWLSFVDVQAVRAGAECRHGDAGGTAADAAADGRRDDGAWQRFAFTMLVPPLLGASSAVHFAVYCRSAQGEFWDNNGGHNYTLRYERDPPAERVPRTTCDT